MVDDVVHETVQYQGLIGKLPGDLMHESGEVLGEYLRKQNRYTDLQTEALLAKQKAHLPVKCCSALGALYQVLFGSPGMARWIARICAYQHWLHE